MMLCQFLLYCTVTQPYVYIYPLLFGFPPHLGNHRALSRVPCAVGSHQLAILYLLSIECIYVNPKLPVHPASPLSPLISIHLFCMSVSISALQIRSSTLFF